jgi:hypothetical protein
MVSAYLPKELSDLVGEYADLEYQWINHNGENYLFVEGEDKRELHEKIKWRARNKQFYRLGLAGWDLCVGKKPPKCKYAIWVNNGNISIIE